MSSTALDRIGHLSPAKQRLLQQKLRQRAEGGDARRAIESSPLRGRTNRFPCSWAQRAVLSAHLGDPASPVYNSSWPMRLRGRLEVAALAGALADLARRHESLRTTFELGEEPMQVVSARGSVSLPVVDLGGLPGRAREARAGELTRSEARRAFDLARGPLLRLTLLRLREGEHQALLTLHHVVTDDWSMGVLVRELGALYQARRQGRRSALPALPIQYADFAHWQHRRLAQEGGSEGHLSYWRERLASPPSPLVLPVDRPRPAGRSRRRGGSRMLAVGAELVASVGARSRAWGATSFMTLLAAFDALLGRYTGARDLVVGTPVAGRSRPETEGLIGCFVNTLALRADLAGDPSFAELVGRVREGVLGAFSHQEVPFPLLLRELDLAAEEGQPLYSVMFSLHNVPAASAPALGGELELERVALAVHSAKLDLILNVEERGRVLLLAAEYDRDLFDGATVDRLLRHFRVLLAGALAEPQRRLSKLALLTAGEAHELVVEVNDTARPAGAEGSAVAAFGRRLAERPEAVAVVGEAEHLSYGGLAGRASALGQELRRAGVGPEGRVGLALERGPELAVGVLAAWWAGGAYLPLDPSQPAERLEWIVADGLGGAGGGVVVGEASSPVAAARPAGVGWLEVAAAPGQQPGEAGWEVEPPPPEQAAYVLYTSGSTGRPKGVVVSHGGLWSYLSWALAAYGLEGAGWGAPLFTSFAFDLAVTSLLGPLVAGRGVEVVRGEGEEVLAELLAVLERRGSWGLVKLTPSHLRGLGGELAGRSQRLAVGCLVVGGEALLGEDLAGWRGVAPGCRVVNEYGPTEAVVGCAVYALGPGEPTPAGAVAIGRPIAGARLYGVDGAGALVPRGVAGELWVGGRALARGYGGRPGWTAERFVPDGWGPPGGRLYRTGDRVRLRGDGALEYLGRLDDQVKVRGYRIEPGEIEAQLASVPGVVASAVVARRWGSGLQLVAWVVLEEGVGLGVEGLKAELGRRLPEYMVPAVMAEIEALPRTAAGKVDRRELARREPPEGARPEPEASALSGVEAVLGEIWRELLGLESVGREENFFELGGDSILGLQMASRARRRGLQVSSRELFQHPTLRALAARVEAHLAAEAGEAATDPAAASATAPSGPWPLTPIQAWFFDQGLAHREQFNQALVLEVGELAGRRMDGELLRRGLERVVAVHEGLRLRFRAPEAAGGAWRPEPDPGAGAPPVPEVDLGGLAPEDRRPAVSRLAGRLQVGLDLGRAPLLRAALLSLGPSSPARLVLVAHHLVVDGVSWRVLLEELEEVCRGLVEGGAVQGRQVALAPEATPLRRWASVLAERARSEAVRGELAYWRDELAAAPPGLPLEREEGANDVGSVERVTVALEEGETQELLRRGLGRLRAGIDELLLTALVEAFASWTGHRRLLVGREGHGREGDGAGELDLSRTVGWLTVLYPLLLSVEEAREAGGALAAVKASLRRVPGSGQGYGLLRYLGEEAVRRELAGGPSPEVLFNYLGQVDRGVSEEGWLRPAAEGVGGGRHREQARPALFEVSGAVVGGRLQMAFLYSRNRHRRATVESLAAAFAASLRELLALARARPASAWVPSDFPLAEVAPAVLERLVPAAGAGQELEDLYPATPTQQGMLFHALEEPGSGVYVSQLRVSLEAELDEAAFAAAWHRLVARQPVLRTGFVWEGVERPLQAVYRGVAAEIRRGDWTGLSAADQARQEARWRAADRRRGFDLGRPPLLRCAFWRLGRGRYGFLLSFHHVVLDGWSMPILLRELFALYEHGRLHAQERGSGLAALGPVRPYRDYVAWLEGRRQEESEAFWRRRLAGLDRPTDLGLEAPEGAVERSYGEVDRGLEPGLTAELEALARRRRVTLNTLVQGAWAVVLARYSGRGEVLFGAVSSGRSAPVEGIEEMVGLFVNTLPARVAVPGERELGAWLEELQERETEARVHEHTPLARIQAWSEVGRGRALFDSIVVFENYPVDASARQAGQSLRIGGAGVVEQTNYPVTLVVVPGRRLALRIAYRGERCDAPTASRMLRHLESVLAAMAAAPAGRLGELELLAAVERQQLLREWGRGPREAPWEGGVHRAVAVRAAATPARVALLWGEERWSYRHLLARSAAVARRLAALGVGAESRVGLLFERCPGALAAMLGVLAAGGAYVPLDAEAPRERWRAVAEDAGLAALLTQEELAGAGAGLAPVVVTVAAGGGEADAGAAPAPPEPVTPEQAAYVIYTSGSTGAAKGVVVAHGGLAGYVAALSTRLALDPSVRSLLFAPLSFDASVVQIYPALTVGGSVVIHPRPRELGAEGIVELAGSRGVTLLDLPAALWRRWVETVAERGLELPPGVRWYLTGGESVPADKLRLWAELLGAELSGAGLPGAQAATFLSSYGPTEATVGATVYVAGLREAAAAAGGNLPIGRPLAGVETLVLDRRGRPAPLGWAGELVLAGAGLARGYLGRPGPTAEAFQPHPFARRPGARVYRTGDLARFRPDGQLQFLGRRDLQVKVRGYRVEPGEVEACLGRHPEVKEAVVLARESAGGRRLVAYLLPHEGRRPAAEELRRHLGRHLPPYMVPAVFVVLDTLPVLASGKVDRDALPEPRELEPEGRSVPPRTPAERLLARVWSGVLGVEKVGVHDDFFGLGGDSILGIQVVSRAREAGLALSVRQLFEHPTVAALARVQGEEAVPEAEQGEVVGTAPLTPVQRWFFEQGFPSPHHFNHAALLEPREPARPRPLRRAAAALLAHHDALRSRFRRDGEGWSQRFAAAAGPLPLAWLDLSRLPAGEQPGAVLALAGRAQTRFDLERGPLTRFVYFELGAGPGRLLWLLHHLVVDGVSWRLLLDDLEAAYRQADAGGEIRLPPKTTSYRAWARGLAHHVHSGGLDGEREHWLQVARAPSPPLPVDFQAEARANTYASLRRVGVSFEPEETEALLQGVPASWGVAADSALLTALAWALASWTGSSSLVLGLESHGREPLLEAVDLSRTVGWFTAEYPLALELGGAGDPAAALPEVDARLRRVPHRGVGYGALRYLRGDRELEEVLRRGTRPQVSFNYLGRFDSVVGGGERFFRQTSEPTGPEASPDWARPQLLAVSGLVAGGRLRLDLGYSRAFHRRATIEALAAAMASALRRILDASRESRRDSAARGEP